MTKNITDFALDDSGDMYADATGLAMVGGLEGIRQQVRLRLGFIRGEWFLDEEKGLPWFEEILVKAPNLGRIETIFRDAILSVRGINEIKSCSVRFSGLRMLTVEFVASTDLGELVDLLEGIPNA